MNGLTQRALRVLKACQVCRSNPVQIRETDMCGPCTFGEAETLYEFDAVAYDEREVQEGDRLRYVSARTLEGSK